MNSHKPQTTCGSNSIPQPTQLNASHPHLNLLTTLQLPQNHSTKLLHDYPLMPEIKDPAIKLFGKTIHLSPHHVVVPTETMVNQHVHDTTSDPTNPEEKPPKPDKILRCPRCNSEDTKFCYYNNYNVNQPRHFCRECQRYWTAGGSMRDTPVGSGRRKNKSPSSGLYYRRLVLDLGESMNQGFDFSDKSQKSEDDSSNSGSRLVENGLGKLRNYPLQIPCFPSSQLCHPWSSAQFRPPAANLYGSGFPVSFNPSPHCWGWSMPMEMTLMNPNSPLGKHSRDEESLKDKDSENIRINDPNKAAKSSLWSSLGMSKDDVVGSSWASLQANPAALSRSLNFRET